MNASFEYTTTLEYRLKAANAQICAFKSGDNFGFHWTDVFDKAVDR